MYNVSCGLAFRKEYHRHDGDEERNIQEGILTIK